MRILRRHGAQITEINVVEQLLLLELRRDLDRIDCPTRGPPQHGAGARTACSRWRNGSSRAHGGR